MKKFLDENGLTRIWTKIKGEFAKKSTTLAGYGITDAANVKMQNPISTAIGSSDLTGYSGIFSTGSTVAGMPDGISYAHPYLQMASIDEVVMQVMGSTGNNLYIRKLETGTSAWKRLLTDSDLTIENGTFTLTIGGNETTDNTYCRIGSMVNVIGRIPASGTATQVSAGVTGLPYAAKTNMRVPVMGITDKVAFFTLSNQALQPKMIAGGGTTDSAITFNGAMKDFPSASAVLGWPELYFNFTYQIEGE